MPPSLTLKALLSPSLFLSSINPKPSTLSLDKITREIGEILHVSHAKSRNFNTEILVGEGDDQEECLNRFNGQIKRMGLSRECRRRRFHESAMEKRKRKAREASFWRRKRHYKPRPRDSAKNSKETSIQNDSSVSDFWDDENWVELIEDEEREKKDMQVCFEEDGDANWDIFDKLSHI